MATGLGTSSPVHLHNFSMGHGKLFACSARAHIVNTLQIAGCMEGPVWASTYLQELP